MQHSSGKKTVFTKLVERYLLFPYFAIGALLFWFILVYLLVFVDPEKLQNVIISNQYVPFLVVWFIAHICTWTVMTSSIRRGVILGLFWMFIVLWKINEMLNMFALLLTVVPLLFTEVFLTVLRHK